MADTGGGGRQRAGTVHGRPDVAALNIDFCAFSGHTLYGVLYGKTDLLATMPLW
ncbi:aminotransferase class V-fold PLP-dependent enzyme [Sodalis sp.]|uniref:aminotransferase class V-fold PLP-dependent enzyme n=1 Tax=Sodalis sp. (in: enterobacteria) TaxID=1898979 RepID=UPI003872B35E